MNIPPILFPIKTYIRKQGQSKWFLGSIVSKNGETFIMKNMRVIGKANQLFIDEKCFVRFGDYEINFRVNKMREDTLSRLGTKLSFKKDISRIYGFTEMTDLRKRLGIN